MIFLDAPENQANANSSNSGDDIFSSFLSATPATNSTSTNGSASNGSTTNAGRTAVGQTEEENFFNQPAPTNQEKNKMTKDSILALYGTSSQQNQAPVFPTVPGW